MHATDTFAYRLAFALTVVLTIVILGACLGGAMLPWWNWPVLGFLWTGVLFAVPWMDDVHESDM